MGSWFKGLRAVLIVVGTGHAFGGPEITNSSLNFQINPISV